MAKRNENKRGEGSEGHATRKTLIVLTALFIVGLALGGGFAFFKRHNHAEGARIASEPAAEQGSAGSSEREIADSPVLSGEQTAADASVDERSEPMEQAPPPAPEISSDAKSKDAPALALIVDDCGADIKLARRAASLDLKLTWAIIPGRGYSTTTAKLAEQKGIPFLIHVPMEALGDAKTANGNKKPYLIGASMDKAEIRSALESTIAELPGAVGVNNHRGSAATESAVTMGAVMETLAVKNMIFVDSNTSPRTIAYKTALEYGLRALKNNHFLDNEADAVKIARQFDFAVKLAKANGRAVAICHLRPVTIAFLESLSGDVASAYGVRVVTIPEMLGE